MIRFGLALLVALGACRAANPPPSSAAAAAVPPTPKGPPTVRLPSFTDPLDPRRAWLEGLTQPPLTRVAGLQWECVSDEETLAVRFGGLEARCEEVIRQNQPKKGARTKGPAPSCRDKSLEIPAKGLVCPKDGAAPELLSRWRMPEGFGLYKNVSPQRLEPLFPDLPHIDIVEESQNPSLKNPGYATWLPLASFQGAIAAVLAPESETGTDNPSVAALEALLLKIRAAKYFNPHFSKRPEARTPSKGAKLPWLSLSTPHGPGLFRDACTYINRWILTRQLTAEPGTIDRSRESRMRCLFVWADQPLPPGSLVLAYLPLPLQSADGRFPFKTVEDSWSPSLIQSLSER